MSVPPQREDLCQQTSNLHIARLDAHPAAVEPVVQWILTQWPEEAAEEVRQMLLDDSDCPPTLVALAGEEPVGVLAFKSHPPAQAATDELWINVLFVESSHRQQGIGRRLVRDSIPHTRDHGRKHLFVFTDIPQFYENLGWQRYSFNKAKQMHVLRIDVTQEATS